MKPREIFLRSLRRTSVPRLATGSATSVITIDLMKKVGVYFPEAHTDAEKMAGLAAAGATIIGFDNVMPLFSVCHESVALGCREDWGAIDRMPDCRSTRFSLEDDITVPKDFLRHPSCQVPLKALKLLKKRYGTEIAVVGKVFGPWTLGYHLFGVENFLVGALMNPDAVKRYIDRFKEVTIAFGQAQIDAGADALCLADHATRDLCSPAMYRDFLLETHHEMSERISCPIILHICGETSDRIEYIRRTNIACYHFEEKVGACKARELVGETMALMGGTSNLDIIRTGTPEQIRENINRNVACNIDILGPECAVPLDAPYENMRYFVEEVKKI